MVCNVIKLNTQIVTRNYAHLRKRIIELANVEIAPHERRSYGELAVATHL